MKEKVELYNLDYEILLKTKINNEKIDIIYIDPPYDSDFAMKSIEYVIKQKIADEDTIIIIETDKEEKILEELKEKEVEIQNKRKYGRAMLIFLKIRKG